MAFYLELDLPPRAIVLFIGWIVADDVAVIDIREDPVVNAVSLFWSFEEFSPTAGSRRHCCQRGLGYGVLLSAKH